MQFRHEVKHEISAGDAAALRARLRAVCKPDGNAKDGKYFIRSLYFDNPQDKALADKLNGVCNREKFRIRFYNNDPSFIRLEKKVKRKSLGYKLSAPISEQEARAIAEGDIIWAKDDERELLRDLYRKAYYEGFGAKTVVDYTREAYIFEAGNVRVTLDYDIRTGLYSTDLLSPDLPTLPIPDSPIILEVKWDNYLPTIIKDIVQVNKRAGAFSKYAACRIYD